MKLPAGVEIVDDRREVSLMQAEDCAGRVGETAQYLRIRQANGGIGVEDNYLVIETERWAMDVDEIDNFAQMLKDFMVGK